MNQFGYNTYKHENVTMKLPVELSKTKMSFFKNGEQEGKTGPIWGLVPVGVGENIRKRCRRVNMKKKKNILKF
jgi:hypothetical protein